MTESALLLLLRQEAWPNRTDRLVLGRGRSGAGFRRRRCCRRGRRGRRRTLFAIGGRRALVELPLLHLLGALLGDDDVTLLLGRGLVVGGFERVGPGLARRLAGAGRVELAAEFERGGQRRVGLAAGGDRGVHVFAGIAMGVEHGFGGRAQRLAGLLVVGEACRHGRKRDREVSAVAGAHAHGAIGA